MQNAVKRAYRLADGAPVEIEGVRRADLLFIARPILDPMATVVVVEIEGDSVTK